MKKFVLLVSLFVFAFTSCEGPMGPPGRPGESGEELRWEIINITVPENRWVLVGRAGELNSYYMYEYQTNLLSEFICEEGNVFGYRWLDAVTQTPLNQQVYVGENDGGGEYLFTEGYSFSFKPGLITFYVDYSDFETGIRPSTCDFRIVLNW